MSEGPTSNKRIVVTCILLLVAVVVIWWFAADKFCASRGAALYDALQVFIQKKGTEQAFVAQTILTNYDEVRENTSRWSGVYWGFMFSAAVLSAVAGLIIKLECFIQNEKLKKDIASIFSIVAAILVTVSTSGDFQKKWQINRLAAAKLERVGYDFLEKKGENPARYMSMVGEILFDRHLAITGTTDDKGSLVERTVSAPRKSAQPSPGKL